jgi:type II secretory pathway predicted ATPase ExeA/tetratricopeptide (TPR) repeat protein
MYTKFYDLREKPFDLSPSSRFLYLGEAHKEALALLTYGFREKKGFGLLTGEVGTGKTTIIHALLADLDQSVHLVHLSNPLLSPREFLDYLARKALGRETPFLSKAEFLIDFEIFLMDCLKSGKKFLLIVDEAHKLSFDLLEEIRLLSNMETAEEKLMEIFLVGQPELRERLNDPRCKALFQRITTHYHLTPLDQDSAGEYIRTRLRAAGAKTPDKIFQESVIKKIHQYSEGYPRRINNLSDNLLLLSYAQGKKKITPEMVTECCRDIDIEVPPLEREEMPRLDEQREATPRPSPTRWNRLSFAIGFLGTIALVLAIGFVRTDMFSQSVGVKPQAGEEQRGIREIFGEGILQEGDKNTSGEPSLSRLEGLVPAEEAGKPRDVPLQEPVGPPVPEHPAIQTEAETGEEGQPPPIDIESLPGRTTPQTLMVLEGQTLRELALEAYGEADEAILAMLQEANPVIEDINLIEVGQRITFPALPMEGYESDNRVARHVPSSTETEHRGAPDRDIYDRIDQDILRSLKEEHPGAYTDFWEGLLVSDSGQRPTDPEALASKEEAKERISHFVQVASGIESETPSLSATTGTLHSAALRAYSELSTLDPSTYAPLLKDSVIYQETDQGDVNLIHALDGPDGAEREEARKRFLLVIHHPDARLRELQTLGHYALETGWLEGAIAAFDRIVGEQEPNYETYNNRAVAYLRTGEMELARNDLNRAIAKDPARPEAFNNMAMTYVHDKAYKDAATYFLHAAKVEPSFHVSLLNAAVVYGQHLKNGEEATRLAGEYLDSGGIFQSQMLIEWLGKT